MNTLLWSFSNEAVHIPAPVEKFNIASQIVSLRSNRLYGSVATCFGKMRANSLPGSSRYSYTKNAMKQIAPTINGARTCLADQEYVAPPHVTARIMRPTPKMKRTDPPMSTVARAGSTDDHLEPFLSMVPSTRSFRSSTKIKMWLITAIWFRLATVREGSQTADLPV